MCSDMRYVYDVLLKTLGFIARFLFVCHAIGLWFHAIGLWFAISAHLLQASSHCDLQNSCGSLVNGFPVVNWYIKTVEIICFNYCRLQNNCSPSDRFITVQCRIFALSVRFFNVYYKQ
jgi:hypothetical protein